MIMDEVKMNDYLSVDVASCCNFHPDPSQRMNDTHNQFQSASLTIITIRSDLGVPGDKLIL